MREYFSPNDLSESENYQLISLGKPEMRSMWQVKILLSFCGIEEEGGFIGNVTQRGASGGWGWDVMMSQQHAERDAGSYSQLFHLLHTHGNAAGLLGDKPARRRGEMNAEQDATLG